ncbi:NAD-dependent epimerase/dehydratase family protein [Flavobacterium gawalongense]|uniref:NAD-dependent epimerase/dehydratase family protein n=1 Tax=Flavobacterium gawalongense TaxID=2594432 RepID=A0A553BFI8_9FLAO|nr:NAD-dependent epimerase/dehydratase family protein [Flavobacterium gawalongense]TRW97140.1 NAD-dependent epimerase/dehydratase family protein [Flavobacterium gawalongense]TRX05348.1 NAD-dependent epimerase/dehydratase family protein [Flavobacterium gawalongense]TRX07017.1 NAD-dependent epimerase/dehydratase family protein [Flavobacterium gawalongense]TRX10321.1 NAD-dependent epimerase/dehydratase family protein [Flavobacterium gawalongense]TRX27671.1 NAD-dependent epimerase/dehydratase fami
MKILITGATGYVGNNLAHTLANRGNKVHAIVRSDSAKRVLQHPNITLFKGDILDKDSLVVAMKGCQQVYHTAAKVGLSIKNYPDFHNTNVEGTRNVIHAILQTGIEKTVFTSTCGVIGPSLNNPLNEENSQTTTLTNAYDVTKKLSEDIIFQHVAEGMNAVIVSPSKIYGPGNISHSLTANAVINMFLKKKITLIPSPGTYQVSFAFIDDIINGHLLAMEKGKSGEKYILGGVNISYQEFFNQIRAISSCNGHIIHLSKNIFKALALLQLLNYKIIGNPPLFTAKSIDYIFNNYVFSSDKAIQELGYKITPLGEALNQTIHFLKNQSHVY